LREKAKLMSEVVVSGNEGFLKVENHQDYEQGLEPMTMEDNIELSKVGI
jgi:hypothetical protein